MEFVVTFKENIKKLAADEDSKLKEELVREVFKISEDQNLLIQIFDDDPSINSFIDGTFEDTNWLQSNKIKIICCLDTYVVKDLGQIEYIDQSLISIIPPQMTYNLNSKFVLPEIKSNSKLGLFLQMKAPETRMAQKLKTQFTDLIYDMFADRKLFYASRSYEQIAEAILMKYPQLGNGLECGIAVDTWVQCLRHKFNNKRRREDAEEESVKRNKKKTTGTVEKNYFMAASQAVFGIKNYLPIVQDDKTANEAHVKWLQLHIRKPIQEEEIVNLKMVATFSKRRQEIVVERLLLPNIVKVYPYLLHHEQLLMEALRVLDCRENKIEFERRLTNFTTAVDVLISTKKEKKGILQTFFGPVSYEEVEDFQPLFMLGKLAVYFEEDPLLIFHATKATALRIEKKGSDFQLCAEDVAIIFPKADGLFLYMAAFFVFHMNFPKGLLRTCTFLQTVLLGVPTKKWTIRMSKLLNTFNSLDSLMNEF